ncbi:aldo/keto reductase [Kribbella sandramycini]|uniref:Aldo/keto reductase n=1 Tax=Kribbella sandramycini TaxID=60450 RepID=A0A7Y4KV48_9ACTN|nr:aldo/keto reductase [Kribbella sandramycini]MBB6568229.1 D-threo-aldose 1-dehydrogenase [Kribbella sandramycini]NOL39178.1 aldo/keto reductase [Kribbella sandramycini]
MAAPSQALAPRTVSGFRPPRFGLGGSRLGEPPGPDGDAAATATVDAAYQAGIRFFDTSPAYGESERRLGAALARRPRGEFLVSTKISGPDAEESIRASAQRLGLAVDLAFLTEPAAVGPASGALEGLRRQGLIKAIGVASGDWQLLDHLVRDHELDCVLLAGHFSLLDQSAQPLLDRCLARSVSVVVSGVLSPEVLHSDSVQARRISAVCERYGVSLAQAALAFPARHAAVTSVLISAASPAEIRADAALVRQPVPATLWRDPELLRLLS